MPVTTFVNILPVITTLPDWNKSNTTGEFCGRYIKPGNIDRKYVQYTLFSANISSRSMYRCGPRCRSEFPTTFCTETSSMQIFINGKPTLKSRITSYADTIVCRYDLQPVSTILPEVKRRTVETGSPIRTVIAANWKQRKFQQKKLHQQIYQILYLLFVVRHIWDQTADLKSNFNIYVVLVKI